MIVFSILSCLSLVVSLVAVFYAAKLSLVYHRFNEQIKDWSDDLDQKMRYAIDAAARGILFDLDRRMDEIKTNDSSING